MAMFALVVSLKVKPERRDEFLKAVEEDGRGSREDEPGCLRFDVLQDNADPDHYYFYEIYRDEAAFDAHKRTPHYARWREAAAECVVEGGQQNTRCAVMFPRDYR
jgi:quinol monooxygenase YgiN